MNRNLRRVAVTAHLASSIGWAGAVLVFLVMAIVGLASRNEATVRGAYLLMLPAAWFVLVPLAHASLLTGIVLSLGTAWGLIRHYWVLTKLVLTAAATGVLLIYMGTFRQMAAVAGDAISPLETVRNASPVLHSILALAVLSIATVLGVYKPFGLTPYGARVRVAEHTGAVSAASKTLPSPAWDRAPSRNAVWILFASIVALAVIALTHTLMRGMHH